MTTRAVGDVAEARAARFLEAQRYRILHRNFTIRGGELDIVARAPDGTLCFVEVRSRASTAYGTPAETIDAKKRASLIKAARVYLATVVRSEPPCRFDVIEIVGDTLKHIPDAFRLE